MEPKISGVLNNCAIHLAVPSIVEQLDAIYLKNERSQYDEAYIKILNDVKAYYNLYDVPDKIVVQKLMQLNTTEQQYLIGLAIREHQLKGALQNDGRFETLDVLAMHDNLYRKLGIAIRIYQHSCGGYGEGVSLQDVEGSRPLFNLNIYQKDNHFELSDAPPSAVEARNEFSQLATECGCGTLEASRDAISVFNKEIKKRFDDGPALSAEQERKIDAHCGQNTSATYKEMLRALVRYQEPLLHPTVQSEAKVQDHVRPSSEAEASPQLEADEALAKKLQLEEDEALAKQLQLEELERAGFKPH